MKALLVLVALVATAHGQQATGYYAGRCTVAVTGSFHLTVAHLDNGKVSLKFSEDAGDYLSYVGTPDSEDPTVIDLDGIYLDGNKLAQVVCPSLTFTTEGTK